MFKDLFSQDSDLYARFRPRYPDALFKYLSSLCQKHTLAWDVGTGNGQAALALVPYFDDILATDASGAQLKNATIHKKIRYVVANAEHAPLADHSVDLVTVAQAFHWFDHKAFFTEVERVLKPQGVLAIWCYDLCNINKELDEIIYQFYKNILGPYWEKERRFIEEGYRHNLFLPREIPTPSFSLDVRWDFNQLLGYLATWSSIKKYQEKLGTDPLATIIPALSKRWGDPAIERHINWKLHIRVGHT